MKTITTQYVQSATKVVATHLDDGAEYTVTVPSPPSRNSDMENHVAAAIALCQRIGYTGKLVGLFAHGFFTFILVPEDFNPRTGVSVNEIPAPEKAAPPTEYELICAIEDLRLMRHTASMPGGAHRRSLIPTLEVALAVLETRFDEITALDRRM